MIEGGPGTRLDQDRDRDRARQRRDPGAETGTGTGAGGFREEERGRRDRQHGRERRDGSGDDARPVQLPPVEHEVPLLPLPGTSAGLLGAFGIWCHRRSPHASGRNQAEMSGSPPSSHACTTHRMIKPSTPFTIMAFPALE
ncbi:MAG: hypothetical protein Q6370_018640 [Candidatus Sigynarchaeota archaeon]